MTLLQPAEIFAGFTVVRTVKTSVYAETYHVKNSSENDFFLKLFLEEKALPKGFKPSRILTEISVSKLVNNANLSRAVRAGMETLKGTRHAYVVYKFIEGNTLEECLRERRKFQVSDAKLIVEQILEGVKYLHTLPKPVFHNELTPGNVMVDFSRGTPAVKIIDFGHARFADQTLPLDERNTLDLLFLAPELDTNAATNPSAPSDLFSVGAILFNLIFGVPPFSASCDSLHATAAQHNIRARIRKERETRLKIPALTNSSDFDAEMEALLARALAVDPSERFCSASAFLSALKTSSTKTNRGDSATSRVGSGENINSKKAKTERTPRGFAAIAGMSELKSQLQNDVIDVLKNPEVAAQLQIPIPNGILFYGPPGCGKTFFAEKFAEEAGYNYRYVTCSDVASPYIHGGQGKIAEIFKDARKHAPTILFLDEIEAMITNRSEHDNASMRGEVNEFLTQLNNCGRTNVLVIGATNYIEKIDPAALRAGRLEYKFFFPLPDIETRLALLKMYLGDRSEQNIDYGTLAKETKNYSFADIKFFADTAARKTFRARLKKISMQTLKETLAEFKPTSSPDRLSQ